MQGKRKKKKMKGDEKNGRRWRGRRDVRNGEKEEGKEWKEDIGSKK